MIRYVLATTTFAERDERVFDEPHDHASFDDFDTAYGVVLALTGRLRSILDALRDALGADGIALDVHPTDVDEAGIRHDYAPVISIELTPYRSPAIWFQEECHDNGRPRYEGDGIDL